MSSETRLGPGAGPLPSPGEIEPIVESLRQAIRQRGFSPHTLHAYEGWIRRFVLFHSDRHPAELGAAEARRFLDHTTCSGRASASTHNQAVNALTFLFREVLRRDVGHEALPSPRAKPSRRIPLALAQAEVDAVLRHVDVSCRLLVALLYGSGLRLSEGCRLRVRDVDFERDQIVVRDGKGLKDRVTLLPRSLKVSLRDQIDRVACLHQADLVRGAASSALPGEAGVVERPVSGDWPWQWAFPARSARLNHATGVLRRGHIHERLVQRAFAVAVRAAGIPKPVTCHSLRHSFAMHLHEAGYDIRTIQALLGHRDVETTLIYVQAPSGARASVRSPLDGGATVDLPARRGTIRAHDSNR